MHAGDRGVTGHTERVTAVKKDLKGTSKFRQLHKNNQREKTSKDVGH